MFFNVSQLLKEPNGSRRAFEVDETFPPMGDTAVSRVLGRVDLLRTDEGVWVSAELESEAVCYCSRCLDEYRQPIAMSIEEEFLPLVDVSTGGGLGRPDDAGEQFHIDSQHILDLSEAIRQYASLSVPIKSVCREDCAGICPSCGANLNITQCGCERASRESRWAPLLESVSAGDEEA